MEFMIIPFARIDLDYLLKTIFRRENGTHLYFANCFY